MVSDIITILSLKVRVKSRNCSAEPVFQPSLIPRSSKYDGVGGVDRTTGRKSFRLVARFTEVCSYNYTRLTNLFSNYFLDNFK